MAARFASTPSGDPDVYAQSLTKSGIHDAHVRNKSLFFEEHRHENSQRKGAATTTHCLGTGQADFESDVVNDSAVAEWLRLGSPYSTPI